MFLLLLEDSLRHKHGEVGIVHTQSCNRLVKEGLDLAPNEVTPWSEDVTARYIVVFQQFGLFDNLCVPFGCVVFLIDFNA